MPPKFQAAAERGVATAIYGAGAVALLAFDCRPRWEGASAAPLLSIESNVAMVFHLGFQYPFVQTHDLLVRMRDALQIVEGMRIQEAYKACS